MMMMMPMITIRTQRCCGGIGGNGAIAMACEKGTLKSLTA